MNSEESSGVVRHAVTVKISPHLLGRLEKAISKDIKHPDLAKELSVPTTVRYAIDQYCKRFEP